MGPPHLKRETPDALMAVTSKFFPKVAMVHIQPKSIEIGNTNRILPGNLFTKNSNIINGEALASRKSSQYLYTSPKIKRITNTNSNKKYLIKNSFKI